jgi:hypothetical protein
MGCKMGYSNPRFEILAAGMANLNPRFAIIWLGGGRVFEPPCPNRSEAEKRVVYREKTTKSLSDHLSDLSVRVKTVTNQKNP